MIKKIITTVGTSLFVNYTKGEVRDSFDNDNYQDISDLLKELENLPSSEYNNPKYQRTIRNIKAVIVNKWLKGIIKKDHDWQIKDGELNLDASAEIKSLFKVISHEKQNYKVYLLYSDSVLSQLAAEILKENLPSLLKQEIEIHCYLIENLVVDSFEKFNIGLINLVKKIREIFKDEFNVNDDTFTIQNKQKISEEFIFNISGGYKATIPFLTLLAQLYNIESKYIFEESDELITIPQINIGIDELFLEKIYLDISSKKFDDMLQIKKLENYKLINNNRGKYEFTVLGEMIKDYAENHSVNAKNVFGYIAEYKLYEYFINNPLTINGITLTKVERSVQYKREFDIVLSNEKKDAFCFCEVKAFYSFLNYKDKIISDLQVRLKAVNDYFPKAMFEYHFYIYTLNHNIDTDKIVEKAKQIKNNYTMTKFFKVFIKENNASYTADNPYQKIVSSKVEKSDIEEIKI
jgi:CRISPR/Cas system-associated protein Csm6